MGYRLRASQLRARGAEQPKKDRSRTDLPVLVRTHFVARVAMETQRNRASSVAVVSFVVKNFAVKNFVVKNSAVNNSVGVQTNRFVALGLGREGEKRRSR
jgi:hypothetical protein